MAKRRRPRNAPIQQSTQKITPVTSIAQRSNLGKNGSSSASAAASIGLIGSLAEPQILVEGGSDTHMVFATSGRPVVNRRLVLDDTLGQATPKILGNNRSALKVLVAGPGGMIIDKRLSMTGSRAFARNVK
ncbi:uncharacterized protein [Spinacia oleracea]|uniref:Uncharacterized protein isoform X1 n=1 Tax=Spinacia oleracea TaxID=3562 RepID=A0A9R0INF6_SPIOL|nr:uncharacterized protein LOC110792120 isoform X1 [Spinacia oleracea]